MFKKIALSLIILGFFLACSKKSTGPNPESIDLLLRIQALPGVEATEIAPEGGFARAFEIDMDVPLDHNNPTGPTITHKVYLSHIDYSLPMSIKITGYRASRNVIDEVASILAGNQIYIGQRYMSESSRPNPINWQYLTMEQSAADHHHLVSLFKSIYKGKWVNSGVSKGGVSALAHRRFYSNDVDVTIAKVAPICLAPEDPRLDSFLINEAGTEDCRNSLKAFQRQILQDKSNIIPLISNYISQSTLTFTMAHEQILEYAVLEYPFSYWQYGTSTCDDVPGAGATSQAMFDHINSAVGLDYYADDWHDYYAPVFYQFFTEFGYYGFITDHLSDLLTLERYSNDFMAPSGVEMVFDYTVMTDILNWLRTEGNNIIYVYGARDTWTAAGVELTGATNAIRIDEPGADHSVQITQLTRREEVYDSLESWLDIEIDKAAISRLLPPEMTPKNRFYDDNNF